MADAGPQIDSRVRRLVQALNALSDVETYSSCGGHRNPTPAQVPAHEFTVSFDVEPSELGWRSLDVIAFAAGEVMADVTAWFNGSFGTYEPGGLSFCLVGGAEADPDAVAGIEELLSPEVSPED